MSITFRTRTSICHYAAPLLRLISDDTLKDGLLYICHASCLVCKQPKDKTDRLDWDLRLGVKVEIWMLQILCSIGKRASGSNVCMSKSIFLILEMLTRVYKFIRYMTHKHGRLEVITVNDKDAASDLLGFYWACRVNVFMFIFWCVQ